MEKTGVLLLSMGGPDSLSAVRPFLYNLFSDPEIIRLPRPLQRPLAWIISSIRAKRTKHYYEHMGGKSPQREQAEELARKLEEALGEGFVVRVAMRYWHPFTEEALDEVFKEGVKRLLLLPLYPQFSRTTTGSSFKEFDRVYRSRGYPEVPVLRVRDYHDHPLYIEAMVQNIKENLPENDHFLLFTAHSLPEYVVKEGDPYREQTERTVRLITDRFPERSWALGYQSRVGPIRWIGPTTEELLIKLVREGVKKVALIPVSFVNEHSETLYELDVQYRKLALDLGVEEFVRIPTLRSHPLFVEALKSIVLERLGGG
ncbi:MAG: ferrochelatase [Aquificota bacterium]|nr:ferrochelatase [Aquificota bacterium]